MQVYERRTLQDIKKLDDSRAKTKVKCEKCGHTISMAFADRTICTHCGYYIYKDEKTKFKYKMKEQLIKRT